MKYIVCEKPGQFLLKEKDRPIRRPGEALLKIAKVGICGTDLHAYSGNQAYFTYPRILGHELSAEVLEIDANEKGIVPGDKVAIMPYISCGHCIACRKGKSNCCSELKVLGIHSDGGMQEILNVPVALLLKTPSLSLDEITLIEPLSIGVHAVERAAIKPGETVLVMGCGPIGLGILKMAVLAGAKAIALDLNPDRLDFASQHFGVAHTVTANSTAREKVLELTKGENAGVVFDATGNREAIESGIHFMGHGGRYVLVGLSKGSLSFSHPLIHAKEASLLCSRNATQADFEKAAEVLGSGRFPVESYITHQSEFTQMITVFESWLEPKSGVIKAVVNF